MKILPLQFGTTCHKIKKKKKKKRNERKKKVTKPKLGIEMLQINHIDMASYALPTDLFSFNIPGDFL